MNALCRTVETGNSLESTATNAVLGSLSRSTALKHNVSVAEIPGFSFKKNSSDDLAATLRDMIVSGGSTTSSTTQATSSRELQYSTVSWQESKTSVWNSTLSNLMAWNTGANPNDGHTTIASSSAAAASTTLGKMLEDHPLAPTSLVKTTPGGGGIDIQELLDSFRNINISSTASEWYNDFEHVSESYILTGVAAFGILMNFLAIVIISWDRRMWPMSRILHNLFLFSEQIFLGLVIAFLQLRAYFLRSGIQRDDYRRLELLNYLTTFVGAAQTFAAWMLYVVATDAYRSVRQLTVSEKIFQIRRAPGYIVFLILVVGVFYSAYLPPVRIEFFKLANETGYNLCNIPIENHWDFKYDEVPTSDLYYILYYSVGYTLFAYVLPFLMICCRDKDIIDILHEAQEQKALLPSRAYVLCPALGVSVACNVYLVCVALKMVILTFKIFEFVDDYVMGAFVFFRYLNAYSNFLQVLKSSLHFFVFMIYNKRLRKIVLRGFQKKRG